MKDHQLTSEQQFQRWARREFKEQQQAMYNMFQVIKELEKKIDGNSSKTRGDTGKKGWTR